MGEWIVFAVCAAIAVAGGFMVFRFDSMARATYSLLASFLAVAVLLLTLGSEFMFAITFLMMIGEMMIMAMFMIAFMMNPAGLNPMAMTHQPKAAAGAGIALFAVLAAVILVTDFPVSDAKPPADVTAAIGFEMMGGSMLVFETAGVLLLTGMIAVVALTAQRGRFGGAITVPRARAEGGGHHHGHGGHEGHSGHGGDGGHGMHGGREGHGGHQDHGGGQSHGGHEGHQGHEGGHGHAAHGDSHGGQEEQGRGNHDGLAKRPSGPHRDHGGGRS